MTPAETQVKMGHIYLLGEPSKDSYESFCLNILSSLLFDGPNSKLYKKLIESGLAPAYCPGAGYDSSTR